MNAADNYREGVSLYNQGRYVKCIKALTPVAGAADLAGRLARLFLGRACRRMALGAGRNGDYHAAATWLEKAAAWVGPSVNLGAYLARLYAGKISPRPAVGGDDGAASKYIADAMALRGEGRDTEALMRLYRGIRRHPNSADLHLLAGLVLAGQDRLSEAKRHFLQATQCDCSCAAGYRYLGLCATMEGRFAQAVGRLERTAALRPGDLAALRELFAAAQAVKREDRRAPLTLPATPGPCDGEDLRRLAQVLLNDVDWASAFLDLPVSEADGEVFGLLAEVLDVALADHDSYADLHHRRSLVAQRLGNIDQAVRHARRAVAINGRYVQGRFHLGSLLMTANPAEAAEQLRSAVSAGGDYADIHATLGVVYHRLGDIDAARRELTRSLEINRHYTPARRALDRLVA